MNDLISVIVATYNREDALDAVLRSLAKQTDRDFEVVVADDGSGPATAELIGAWQARMPLPLRHVWHEDRGFRAAEIRNRAIRDTAARYCIFLDGDSLARADFVAAHRRLAEPGWFVAGNRVLLSQSLSQAVLSEGLAPEAWGLPRFVRQRLDGMINRLAPLLPLPFGPLRKLGPDAWKSARSCNLAVWRDDLLRIDGFDAAFSGWGFEDSDLVVRLIRSGVRRKDGRFATGVLHLWHPENDRSQLSANTERLAEIRSSERVRATAGISALCRPGEQPA